MSNEYRMVIGVEDGGDLRSSQLYINDVETAQKEFKRLVKELDQQVTDEELEELLDEGWYYTFSGVSILIIDPVVVIKKD